MGEVKFMKLKKKKKLEFSSSEHENCVSMNRENQTEERLQIKQRYGKQTEVVFVYVFSLSFSIFVKFSRQPNRNFSCQFRIHSSQTENQSKIITQKIKKKIKKRNNLQHFDGSNSLIQTPPNNITQTEIYSEREGEESDLNDAKFQKVRTLLR